jgi:sugar phosphate isomerase/epimerase
MYNEITVAGKAPPESDELQRASAQGFDFIELYIEQTHLQDIDATISNIEQSAVEVVSVHTPHVPIDEPEWLRRSDELAYELDAYLVVHSNRIIHTFIEDLEELKFQSDYGYENNPGVSERHIRSMILDQGHEFVLDTAHLYMAESDYITKVKQFLKRDKAQIKVIHLCDSNLTKDGLGFRDGNMDMKELAQIIGESFKGVLVLEVMADKQIEARDLIQSYWTTP